MSSNDLEILRDKVAGFLREMGLPTELTHHDLYLYRFDSTVVMVSLFQQGDHAYVRVASVLLKYFRPNLELITRLLRLNSEVLMGSFLVFEDDTLSFAITLPGESLSPGVLERCVRYVARISHSHADEFQMVAGGLKAEDLLDNEPP